MFIKTYQNLVLQKFIKNFLKVSGTFFSLVFVINIFEEINFFKDTNESLILPLGLTFLNSPSIFFDLLPFIFFITTQFFLEILDKNEL